MNELNQFLWVIFPYVCIAIFIFGHIVRYRNDKFNWAAKSSEFLEKKQLMIGSALFHLGIIPVFIGHFVGLVIPKSWMNAIGVNEHIYHIGAVYIGGLFGFLTLLGMLILTFRRISIKPVRLLSSAADIIVNLLLLLIIFLGVYATFVTNAVNPDFDYRSSISVWFRSLFVFQPNATYMVGVPLSFKLHVLAAFLIFAFWPFTRLVHVWSLPFNYSRRSYILYRRNERVG